MGLSFLFPGLFALGAALIAVPIVIHLLNLRRQRVVVWAAMDFLLESERRNRTWIEIKRWLLLATRILMVLLAAALVAKPQLTSLWAQWLSQADVQHVVLLDDSYSMSDTGTSPSVWEAATTAAGNILKRSQSSGESNGSPAKAASSATLVTTSELLHGGADVSLFAGDQPRPDSRLASLVPTEQAPRLGEAVDQLRRELLARPPSGNAQVVVSVVSDFRQVDLQERDRFKASLANLKEQVAGVQLVQCVATGHANLTLSGLTLLPGPHAAKIEIPAQLTVTNHSRQEVDKVLVQVQRNGVPLPAIEVGPLAAGEATIGKFSLRFDQAGSHTVQASLPSDAIEADNHRHLALSLAEEQSVLIVDGSSDGLEGLVYSRALNPGDAIATGWRPVVRRIDGSPLLSDAASYQAVLLLNVERLLPGDVAALQGYVGSGGGLFISLGDQVDPEFYNETLFREAKLLPTSLDLPTRPKTSSLASRAALSVTDHHLFRVFQGERNSFLDLVLVNRYFALEPNDVANDVANDAAMPYSTLASLTDDGQPQPLVIESSLGKGKVVCLLTTSTRPASRNAGETPAWSNLSTLPIFPVFVNELVAYQSASLPRPKPLLAGANGAQVEGITGLARQLRSNSETASEPWGLKRPLSAGFYSATLTEDEEAGQLLAVNVDPQEGDLAVSSLTNLQQTFADIDIEVASASRLMADTDSVRPGELYQMIACLLIGLMAFELLISYLCSYHPRSGAANPTSKIAMKA